MGSRRSQHARGSVVGFLALGLTGVFASGETRAQTVPAPPPTALPRAIPAPSFAVAEHYAGNLGITYQLVPHGPAFGARLTRDAPFGSAASQLRLEAGDMIISLDGQLINRPEDVLAHVGRTDVVFINIRTGAAQGGVMLLPMQRPLPGPGPGPGPIEPLPPLGPFRLGITTVPVQLNWPLPGAPPGPVLGLSVASVEPGSPAASANIRPGDVILRANGEATPSNAALRLITARSSGVVSLLVAPGGRVDQVVLSQVDMRRAFMTPAPGAPAPVPSPPPVPSPAPVPAPTSPAPSPSPPRPVPF